MSTSLGGKVKFPEKLPKILFIQTKQFNKLLLNHSNRWTHTKTTRAISGISPQGMVWGCVILKVNFEVPTIPSRGFQLSHPFLNQLCAAVAKGSAEEGVMQQAGNGEAGRRETHCLKPDGNRLLSDSINNTKKKWLRISRWMLGYWQMYALINLFGMMCVPCKHTEMHNLRSPHRVSSTTFQTVVSCWHDQSFKPKFYWSLCLLLVEDHHTLVAVGNWLVVLFCTDFHIVSVLKSWPCLKLG